MRARAIVLLVLCFLLSLHAACDRPRPAEAPELRAATQPLERAAVGSPWEVTLQLAAVDPLNVEARFVTPSGKMELVGGFPSHGTTRVRYTPRESGSHKYVVTEGPRELRRGSLIAFPSSARKGFVSRDPQNAYRLVADDATVLVLGENGFDIYGIAIPDRLDEMRGFGMSTIRVPFFSDCESNRLGCLEPRVGHFDERTADAIDTLFIAAERTGIDVILVLHAHGFGKDDEVGRRWIQNPYSVHQGGPAATPLEFFESLDIREKAKDRVKYIANRWGAFPRLLAIDLLDEPEWNGTIPEPSWIAWGKEMSSAWRAYDPYGHLVTAGSIGLSWNVEADERPFYASKTTDLVQWHLYDQGKRDPVEIASALTRDVEVAAAYRKPIFCGDLDDEDNRELTHAAIWTLLMSGSGALSRSRDPATRSQFKPLADFLSAVDPKAPLFPNLDVRIADSGARVWSLVTRGETTRLLWILAPSKDVSGIL